MGTNIADWIKFWGNFDRDLYIAYLIARQNKEDE